MRVVPAFFYAIIFVLFYASLAQASDIVVYSGDSNQETLQSYLTARLGAPVVGQMVTDVAGTTLASIGAASLGPLSNEISRASREWPTLYLFVKGRNYIDNPRREIRFKIFAYDGGGGGDNLLPMTGGSVDGGFPIDSRVLAGSSYVAIKYEIPLDFSNRYRVRREGINLYDLTVPIPPFEHQTNIFSQLTSLEELSVLSRTARDVVVYGDASGLDDGRRSFTKRFVNGDGVHYAVVIDVGRSPCYLPFRKSGETIEIIDSYDSHLQKLESAMRNWGVSGANARCDYRGRIRSDLIRLHNAALQGYQGDARQLITLNTGCSSVTDCPSLQLSFELRNGRPTMQLTDHVSGKVLSSTSFADTTTMLGALGFPSRDVTAMLRSRETAAASIRARDQQRAT